ncbi:MAG: DUF1924 domain-containing protein [Magnetococcales bacterium]|nr:DUF1924 domain-containing protein [Magnetococcales bacterium]MBF0114894.1 DUF1924 domain-containing protein [Magnetococcales bacterium]
MHRAWRIRGGVCVVSLLLWGLSAEEVAAGGVEELLQAYRGQGAGPFLAAQGERLFHERAGEGAGSEASRCADCHGQSPGAQGRHVRTGKEIAPLSPLLQPERLQDAAKVEKWFLRNCKGTWGRACSAQEKGDLLTYFATVR